MISLDDVELEQVLVACQPLQPDQRPAFMRAVASELAAGGREVGPGSVHCAIVKVQPRFRRSCR